MNMKADKMLDPDWGGGGVGGWGGSAGSAHTNYMPLPLLYVFYTVCNICTRTYEHCACFIYNIYFFMKKDNSTVYFKLSQLIDWLGLPDWL